MTTFLSFSSTFTYIGYILLAIVVLLVMVLIHEFGHYIAGKILKFKINEFSVGFGPKLLQKKKKNGELFTLRLIPLGGYCAFDGETEENKDNPNAFSNQKPWKRLIVLFCGAFFNFLSAIVFSFVLLLSAGYDYVQVKKVEPTSINYSVMQAGDVVTGVEGEKINFVSDRYFNNMISETLEKKYPKMAGVRTNNDFACSEDGKNYYYKLGQIDLNIKRDGKPMELTVNVNVIFDEKEEYAGWSLLKTNEDTGDFSLATYKYSFGESLLQAFPFTCKWAWKVLKIFGQLITGQLAITSLGGPVTTINMIASYTQTNFSYLLLLLPVIAVNLAVFNLLPIPALDGFQMIFVIIEWIRKKPVKQELVNTINNIGLIVLFGFVILVDILQFVL